MHADTEGSGMQCDQTYTGEGLGYPAAARPEWPSSTCAPAASRFTVRVTGNAGEVVLETECAVPRSSLLAPGPALVLSRTRACTGGTLGDENTRSAWTLCEPGTFCWYGLRFDCPPGRYASVGGQVSSNCEAACPAGYYCPWGTANPFSFACGSHDVYCPAGSGAPTPVDKGYYTPVEEAAAHRTRQHICEAGFFCVHAARHACPPGTYSDVLGLSSAAGCLPCAPGFYCPYTNHSVATAVQCGSAAVYCPLGSATPVSASPGYYTVGGYERQLGLPESTTRVTEVACEPGTYCERGIRRACPAGTYGATARLNSSACSGECERGHFCPPGSTRATQFRCGDMFILLADVASVIQPRLNASVNNAAASISNPIGPLLTQAYSEVHTFLLMAFTADGNAVAGGLRGTGSTGAFVDAPLAPPSNTSVAAIRSSSACPIMQVSDLQQAVTALVYDATSNSFQLEVSNIPSPAPACTAALLSQ
ncbi:hypothetical protein EON62_04000, partial [archaeon]